MDKDKGVEFEELEQVCYEVYTPFRENQLLLLFASHFRFIHLYL